MIFVKIYVSLFLHQFIESSWFSMNAAGNLFLQMTFCSLWEKTYWEYFWNDPYFSEHGFGKGANARSL